MRLLWLIEDEAVFDACLANRRRVDERHHLFHIGREHVVEELLVAIEQVHQIDVAVEVGGESLQVGQDQIGLLLLALHYGRKEAVNAQRFAFG